MSTELLQGSVDVSRAHSSSIFSNLSRSLNQYNGMHGIYAFVTEHAEMRSITMAAVREFNRSDGVTTFEV